MNFQRARSEQIAFPLAPMIDVIFLLLCFFVSSQIFAQWETDMPIQLPTAQTGEVPQRLPGEIIINIRSNGQVVINGRELDETGLENTLTRLRSLHQQAGIPVVLRADKTTSYEHVIRVLDQCRQADVYNISFATAIPE